MIISFYNLTKADIFSMIRSIIFIVLSISLTIISTCFANVLEYDIKYLEKNDPVGLHIDLKSKVDASGQFILRLPWGSHNLLLKSSDENLQLEQTDDTFLTKFKAKPDSEFILSYDFALNNPYHLNDWAIIEPQFFVFSAQNVLATPETQTDETWVININMASMPSDFSLSSSFSLRDRVYSVESNIYNFRNHVFVGGSDSRNTIIMVNEKPISIFTRGPLSRLPKKSEYYFDKLISAQRNFWNDHDFPHYLAVVQEYPCEGTGAASNGRHYQNAFIAQLPHCKNDFEATRESMWMISHELFHAWLGYKIKVEDSELPHLFWFIEGFNDYYGLKIAFESGLLDFSGYIAQYNALIRYYYLLPIKQIANETIANNHQKDMHYRLLAQIRGHFLAKALAKQLANTSLSLDSLMHKILVDKQQTTKPYKREDLYKLFNDYLGEKQWQEFYHQIQEGGLIDFLPDDFGENATLISLDVDVADLGFDLQALIETQTIRQLDTNSKAYEAGLREGQKIGAYSVNLCKPYKDISFGIEENGEYKEITFTPNKIKKQIPQYVLKES